MKISLLSDNKANALRLYKFFYAERITLESYAFEEFQRFMATLFECDGVLISVQSELHKIEQFLSSIITSKQKIYIIILCHMGNFNVQDLHRKFPTVVFYYFPFNIRQIAMQLRVEIYRLKETLVEDTFILRDIELNLSTYEVKYHNEPLKLRHKEFELLHFLILNKGKVLTRSTILENVWDRNANILTNTVDVHMSHLRKKLDSRAKKKYIRTIPCTGYLFE